ncbi:hypothetical protein Pan258_54900 [Symmachiella dynata]|nr:hypothetical protein Pan258_54900 [Symmachiella dynata]
MRGDPRLAFHLPFATYCISPEGGKQSSGGSDCPRQSVCRRHKTQQFQLSLPMRLCLFRSAQTAASCGLCPPRLLGAIAATPGYFSFSGPAGGGS